MQTVYKAGAQAAILRRSPEKLSKLAALDLVSRTDLFLFDCDGVLWKGDTAIPGASGVLDKLRSLGKRVCFVTNNSTRSRAGFLKKFEQLGLRADVDDIFTSSFAVAAYFQQNPLPPDKKCYIIGEEGIGAELDLVGIPHIGGPRDATAVVPKGTGLAHDPDVGAVVVGFDSQISYYKIQYAQLCINTNPGCRFLATNLDRTAHLTSDQEWAAGGAMVGAVRGCTGREPILVGKPAPLLVDYLVDKYRCERSRILMVGDRLDTDVLFGADHGLQTLLVLSGVTTEAALLDESNDIRPDAYADSIADLC